MKTLDVENVRAVGAGNTVLAWVTEDGRGYVVDAGHHKMKLALQNVQLVSPPAPYNRFVSVQCGYFHVVFTCRT
jgi:hypothetical protein